MECGGCTFRDIFCAVDGRGIYPDAEASVNEVKFTGNYGDDETDLISIISIISSE
jgi:hypothetical protein